jgi:hypothetical protein
MSGSGGEFEDLGAALWAAGVDYIAGWREAADAAAELASALTDVCPDGEAVTAVALSAPEGSGTVQLRVPPATAHAMAKLIRAAKTGHGTHRSAI